jgi:hypothetical protein
MDLEEKIIIDHQIGKTYVLHELIGVGSPLPFLRCGY